MDYTLFEEFITLQALLKTTGVIHSGGAIKGFLAENQVLVNGEVENRRGKKIRVGDSIELPTLGKHIEILAPSAEEVAAYQEDLAEKERVKQLVKKLNQENKKTSQPKVDKVDKKVDKKPVRFPGT